MPDPKRLKVGDRVRFIALPEEWQIPNRCIPRDSITFMRRMIRRRYPSRVARISDEGYPWIDAQMVQRGKKHYHSWLITESTGWRLVRRRSTGRC
jgi:hypothetical protein